MLPMPISPMPKAVTPSLLASPACSMPAASASSACRRVMASSRAMLPVVRRMCRSKMAAQRGSWAMPTSTTVTWSPKQAAMEDIPVTRRVIFTACCRVTERGAQDTPSSTTPLSAANTATRHLSMAGQNCPVMPASRMEMVSSAPRLPGGLASAACRFSAAVMAAPSAGAMVCMYACSSCSVICAPRYSLSPPAIQVMAGSPDFQW